MAYNKKKHYFNDCGSNMGAGDRSKGHLTKLLHKVTCGTCKRRLLESIAAIDWTDEVNLDVVARLEAALERIPGHVMDATTKGRSRRSNRSAEVKKAWACAACYKDKALPAEDQFGIPRGRDVRKSNLCDQRYCGTCGNDYNIERL
jgi:hypothetical protein